MKTKLKERLENWCFSSGFYDAPEEAEELRVDRSGNLYWCDNGKVAWTKSVNNGTYSALSSDKVIATKHQHNRG